MLNCAAIMGRIVYEPELRKTGNDISVVSIVVAVDKSYVPKGEDRQADFIDVVAWRQTAEFISKYFHKGTMIAVQGSIQTRNYTDRDGNSRKSTEVVADNVSFCGGKEQTEQTNQTASIDYGDFTEIPESNLPF